ncbi:2TM domain-containing protein [Galbibacter sp. BG1]|uniref:2TM domain-containing protein n=1 Tax=Galbibacter sp. BG1 TaxID=1170699 RepID=UPI0015BE611C|nr:2TM domain-containing protein [Galbibacter sp. BG1]QLE00231.1 2TM domain-containing protein [Galbibacter sp. BG1]
MTNQNYNLKLQKAKRRVKELKSFYSHLAVFLIINGFIMVHFFISTLKTGESFWQWTNFLTMAFWGIGLIFHALHTFGRNIFFSKEWEQQQIDKYMEEEKQHEQSLG